MKGIASVAVAVLLSTAMGGVFFSDSQAVNQPDVLVAQNKPRPTPTPTTPPPTSPPRR